MSALLPMTLPFLIGWLGAHTFCPKNTRYRGLLVTALAGPTGLGLTSLLIFASYLIFPRGGYLITLIILILTGLFLLLQLRTPKTTAPLSAASNKAQNNKSTLSIICQIIAIVCLTALTYVFMRDFLSITISEPFGEWDARLFWNVKAKFYVRVPELWKDMFSPLLGWAHPDYPLLIPGAVSWGWLWLGNEATFWPACVALTFSISIALLVFWYVLCKANLMWACISIAFLFSLPLFRYWSPSQLADIPLCFFITSAVILLITAYETHQIKYFCMTFIMAGLGAWTKNEGLVFCLLLSTLSLPFFFTMLKKNANDKSLLFQAGLFLFLPLAACLYLKLFLAGQSDYLNANRTMTEVIQIFTHNGFENSRIALHGMLTYMFGHEWNYLWPIFFGAILTLIVKGRYKTSAFLIPSAVGLILAAYLVTMQLSPHPLVWQIQTAMVRLLLHVTVLALICSVEVFSNMSFTAENQ